MVVGTVNETRMELEALADQLDDALATLEALEDSEPREFGKLSRRNGAVYHLFHARQAIIELNAALPPRQP